MVFGTQTSGPRVFVHLSLFLVFTALELDNMHFPDAKGEIPSRISHGLGRYWRVICVTTFSKRISSVVFLTRIWR
jgi:hypothetical protein